MSCGWWWWFCISCLWLAVSTEFRCSGLGCGESGRVAAGGAAAGGESVATGRVGEPVGLGVTTGMGMTVMGMEGRGREGGMGAWRHSVWRSSALQTLLMWIVGLYFTSECLCSANCSRRCFSFSSSSVEERTPVNTTNNSFYMYTLYANLGVWSQPRRQWPPSSRVLETWRTTIWAAPALTYQSPVFNLTIPVIWVRTAWQSEKLVFLCGAHVRIEPVAFVICFSFG